MSSATRTLQISASPILSGLYTVIHAGALACLLISTVTPVAACLLAVAVLLSAWVHLGEQGLLIAGAAIVAINMDEHGCFRLWQRNRVCIEGLQLKGGANTALVLCLTLAGARGKTHYLNIARDAMHEDELRSLRMRFEYALAHGNSSQA